MTIERFETFQAPPRWLFLRAGTDAGVAGWGEPVVEDRVDAVEAGVHDYLVDRSGFAVEDRHVQRLSGPRLGSDEDEAEVRRVSARHGWRPPVWRHADGSLAGW